MCEVKMAQWKLGYPNSLDGAASYTVGKALYDKYGVIAITHDVITMCRAVGQVNGSPTTTLIANNITNYPNVANTTFASEPTAFTTDEFNNGFIRMLNGTCENKVYKITNTTASTLVSSTNFGTAGVSDDDYFEVVTGSCTFTFPSGRNPTRRDYKRTFKGSSIRFPQYYGNCLVVPIGFEQDDMVIMTYFTDERDSDRLEVFLNHLLDYKGFDGFYSTGVSGVNDEGLAPMVLETGSTDIRNQYLVYMTDYKIIKDAKRSDDVWEVMIHLQNFSRPMYKGI